MCQDEGWFNEPSPFPAILPAAGVFFFLAEGAVGEVDLWRSGEPFRALLFIPVHHGDGQSPSCLRNCEVGIAAEGVFHAISPVSPGAPRAA